MSHNRRKYDTEPEKLQRVTRSYINVNFTHKTLLQIRAWSNDSCIVLHPPKVLQNYVSSIGKRHVKSSLLQKLATFSDSRTGETASGALRVAVPLPRTANTVIMLGIVDCMDFKHGIALETNTLRFRDRISLGYQVKKCPDCCIKFLYILSTLIWWRLNIKPKHGIFRVISERLMYIRKYKSNAHVPVPVAARSKA